MNRYRVPKQRTRIELRVSNSRFIATVAPASTAKEAQAFLRAIREEMPDATHHVYAFRIGHGASVTEGLSDDGEPSGTAGPPSMAVLRGTGLGDVALVITRYFGGTKLGTGGLVSAYTEAAQAVFAALETEEKVTRVRIEIALPYAVREPLHRLLGEFETIMEDEQFDEAVRLRLLIPEEQLDDLTQRVKDLTAGKVTPQVVE